MLKQLLYLGFSLSLLISCNSSNSVDQASVERPENFKLTDTANGQELKNGELLSAERIVSLSIEELQQRLNGLMEPRNAIHLYRLTYRTMDPDGSSVNASGLVALPADQKPFYPLIALQHGTITSQLDAPSVSPRQGILEASQGFMVAIADYIGFGSSAAISDPYLIPQAYVQAGLDMIRATRQFALQNQINVPVFFLAGYSEGGYASLAMQKAIETQDHLRQEFLSDSLRLLASAPAAGPYNLSLAAIRSSAQERINAVNILKVIKAYRRWHPSFEADYISFFQPASFAVSDNEALQIKIEQDLLSGRWQIGQLLTMITSVTADLVQADYLDYLLSVEFDEFNQVIDPQQDPNGLLPLLNANDLTTGWAPRVPTRLYHCQGDEVVPVVVATAAVEGFKTLDPETRISAVIIDNPSFGHGNCPAVISPIDWFASFLAAPQP